MVGEVDVGSSPVNERGPSLRSRDDATASRLDRGMVDYARRTHQQAIWLENQSARPSQSKQRPTFHGNTEDISRRDFVRIAIYADSIVALRIRGPRVVGLNTVVPIEVVAICGKNAGAVGGVLLNPVLGRLFHEVTQRLNRS